MTTDHPSDRTDRGTHGYASVNGLEMYYEIRGAGAPLVLLHGAMGTIETEFGKLLPSLRPSTSRSSSASIGSSR